MFSDSAPHGMIVPETLTVEYEFICQLYSSDFSEPFKDIFYLTDAVGYLFLKKWEREGVFLFKQVEKQIELDA